MLMVTATLAALAGCGEKPQSMTVGGRQDTAAFQGTGMPYTAAGWKTGDKTSWESQLKARTQSGQNDYNKVN
ncbi:MAG: hypothetical protein LH617_11320 [Ramlibacter sp.]|nr:hypothetical protein [Ramlibacter sp.]